ncbi:MAG: HlyD family efflux transporter periplasmic adaptor subunit [Clostridia bacterium]
MTYIKQEENDEYLISLEVKKEIAELINYRKISFDLIWLSYSGLKVPNDAITQKDGINYVVRNRAGYLSKIPIRIGTVNKKEAKNEKYTIIENYTTDELRKIGYTDKQINNFKKISIYDEIMLNPDLDKIE